ncbi:hypothetical protein ACTMTF_18420 [Nonomuraea sp. ZG12]
MEQSHPIKSAVDKVVGAVTGDRHPAEIPGVPNRRRWRRAAAI